jgi:hypothetical protein
MRRRSEEATSVPLARGGVLEEVLALDRGSEGRRNDGEERVGDVRLDRAQPADDSGVRLPVAHGRRRSELSRRAATGESAGGGPPSPRRAPGGSGDRSSGARGCTQAARGPLPERDVCEDVEREQEPELDLDREEGELEESRARDRLAEERGAPRERREQASATAAAAPRTSASSSSSAAASSTIAEPAYQTEARPSPMSSSANLSRTRRASARTPSRAERTPSGQPSRK